MTEKEIQNMSKREKALATQLLLEELNLSVPTPIKIGSRLSEIIGYYDDGLTTAQIMKKTGISTDRNTFATAFKKFTNVSVVTYYLARDYDKAKQILKEQGLDYDDIKNVFEAMGINDV